jgi:hypothetical protein
MNLGLRRLSEKVPAEKIDANNRHKESTAAAAAEAAA